MIIYHATSYENGTKILMERKLRTNKDGQVFFCLNHSDLKKLVSWWRDINFKPVIEMDILCLEVEDVEIYPDPATTSHNGWYTNRDLRLK